MKKNKLHIIKNLVTAIVVTLFFSCENDFNEVQKVGMLQNQPIGEAVDLDLDYTEFKEDTVRLLSNLLSPKMLDYSNRNFAFNEFPEGLELSIFDEKGNKTTITSDYAIVYSETDMIDLRGNVRIATYQKDTLFTEQLYYNQKLEWAFTNEPFLLKSLTSNLYGIGFDSDKNLKAPQVLEPGGDFEFKK
ncbi:LPS export ABC transporter periplasmic protein LptC [Winogradskyella undariae]|uniref:LPS export ABC transporter periplasmic protein LptC n=1 Tax=Winogradskyella undariae TaxID=1285465 RepID=UPI0015C91030|nr:LPS export ABC transporter periplasmic protein LptC [Winogradskyella undariae]QNK76417.1 LPS export ABC transporter periplasmic protein LptC [Winogradskyella sp. PAMC22761]